MLLLSYSATYLELMQLHTRIFLFFPQYVAGPVLTPGYFITVLSTPLLLFLYFLSLICYFYGTKCYVIYLSLSRMNFWSRIGPIYLIFKALWYFFIRSFVYRNDYFSLWTGVLVPLFSAASCLKRCSLTTCTLQV